jgi:hypothetical protein
MEIKRSGSQPSWRGPEEYFTGNVRVDPVTIWVVRLGDDLYARSCTGRGSSWFRAVQARHEGWIGAGGIEKDVTFVEETDSDTNDQIDSAYREKYLRYGAHVVTSMVSPEVRIATIKLLPRSSPS